MKKIHKSKTVWTNVLLFALLFIPELDHAFFEALGINEKLTMGIVAILTKLLVILNIVFRFETNQKLEYPK
jgi:hypothetical protein